MKRNAALWYFLTSSLLVWLFVLIGDDVTPTIFESKFKNNKWTCWSLYSLYYLAHDEFFTRMSRAALMLLQIFWQGLIITMIYCFGYLNTENSLILWAALLGWVLAIPAPFLMARIFLQPIYQLKIQKYLNLVNLRFKDL